jgi:predicted nucleic acid-binding protein
VAKLKHWYLKGVQMFIVLDSNVLISYLPLVREILATISRQALKMALCLPSVVVAELNFLKERNASPNTRALAQEANTFLLAQVRSRSGRLRGQQKHEHLGDAPHVRVCIKDP